MRRKATRRAALPALAVMLMGLWPVGGAAAAGVGPWTAIGPHGGTVLALAADPAQEQTVYAAVETAGLLKSVNGGASWTEKWEEWEEWGTGLSPRPAGGP